jgi:hypothetical protein
MTHTQFLLKRLAATDAIIWSLQTDSQSIQALSNLLAVTQEQPFIDRTNSAGKTSAQPYGQT